MFWIKVDVKENGNVVVSTHPHTSGDPRSTLSIRERQGTTVSQALRSLAAAMVTAKAELVEADKD